jgi:hypothetical protein
MSTAESMEPYCDVLLKARDLLNDLQIYHSEFQIRWFIITRTGGTPYGCYKQALLEIDTRLRAISMITEKAGSISDAQGGTKQVVDTLRELDELCRIATHLKAKIGCLDSNKRDLMEADLWTFRVKKMAVMDFMTEGRLCRETVELLLALPSMQRKQIIDQVLTPANHNKLIHEFLTATYITEAIEYPSSNLDESQERLELDNRFPEKDIDGQNKREPRSVH